jgi:hypothetical protein
LIKGKSLAKPALWRFSSMFLSRSFMVSSNYAFHFECIIMYGIIQESNFILLYRDI